MKQITDEMGNVTLTMNEYELHNFLCTAYQELARMVGIHDDDWLECIKIEPEEEKWFTPELVTKWEGRMDEFLKSVRTNDSTYHDDAEYTCG